MHFSASTFLASYLHQLVAIFGANLASKLNKFKLEMHILKALFGTNLVSNISTKASINYYLISTLLVQIRYRFNAHFRWEIRCRFNAHFSWDMGILIMLMQWEYTVDENIIATIKIRNNYGAIQSYIFLILR